MWEQPSSEGFGGSGRRCPLTAPGRGKTKICLLISFFSFEFSFSRAAAGRGRDVPTLALLSHHLPLPCLRDLLFLLKKKHFFFLYFNRNSLKPRGCIHPSLRGGEGSNNRTKRTLAVERHLDVPWFWISFGAEVSPVCSWLASKVVTGERPSRGSTWRRLVFGFFFLFFFFSLFYNFLLKAKKFDVFFFIFFIIFFYKKKKKRKREKNIKKTETKK